MGLAYYPPLGDLLTVWGHSVFLDYRPIPDLNDPVSVYLDSFPIGLYV